MELFDQKNPLENVVLTFNFSFGLPGNALLTGTPTVTVQNLTGGDVAPSALLNGPAQISADRTQVLQPITGGLDGNDYVITAVCPTTSAPWQLALAAVLPVRAFSSTSGAP